MAYDGVHSEVLEAVAAGKIPNIEKLITRKIALEDVVEQGFETLLNDRDSQGELLEKFSVYLGHYRDSMNSENPCPSRVALEQPLKKKKKGTMK